jgi:hypothetical protein
LSPRRVRGDLEIFVNVARADEVETNPGRVAGRRSPEGVGANSFEPGEIDGSAVKRARHASLGEK